MAGEANPEGDSYWIAPRTNLYAIKEDGYKLIHTYQELDSNELFAIEAESLYERENVANAEPERVAAMWDALREKFSIPTEFWFMPLVERP